MPDAHTLFAASQNALGTPEAIAHIRTISGFADCTSPRGEYTTEIHSARGGCVWFQQVWANRSPTAVIINPPGAWATDPATGETEALDPVSVSMVRGHEFQMLPLTLAERYTQLEPTDDADWNNEPCFTVRALDDLNLPCTHYFRKRDSRWAGMRITNGRDHTQTVSVIVNTWSETDGVFLPASVTATDSAGDFVLNFKTITLNTAPDSFFETPESPNS